MDNNRTTNLTMRVVLGKTEVLNFVRMRVEYLLTLRLAKTKLWGLGPISAPVGSVHVPIGTPARLDGNTRRSVFVHMMHDTVKRLSISCGVCEFTSIPRHRGYFGN